MNLIKYLKKSSIFTKAVLAFLFTFVALIALHAQPDSITTIIVDPLPGNPLPGMDIDALITWEHLIYSALFIVFTYLSYLIPGLKVKPLPIRAIAIGVLLIGVFVVYRLGNNDDITLLSVLSFIVNYVLTTGAYDKILKPLFGGSKKNEADKTAALDKVKKEADTLLNDAQ